VAIARAVVNEPRLILADEPTGNLDSASGAEIRALIQRLNREHRTTVLIVTHDRQVARIAQRILTMKDGKVVEEHRVRDPISEDLWDLAHSELGRRLAARDITSLTDTPLVVDRELTDVADQLCEMLEGLSRARETA
jgi:ABC-type methionine transport system ATPase subunit